MKNNQLRNYQILSVIFTFFLGTLLHFTFELTGRSPIIASFSAINESVWEHLKLLFFPMLITIFIGYLYIGKDIPNFICSKTTGILISMAFTVIFFYTYSGILGTNKAIIDISSFFIAAILGEYVSYKLIKNFFGCNNKIAIIILISCS